jgi:hypothetical protein
MSLLSGTKVGPYEIVAPIGAAHPLAPATFPQIQALRSSNPRSAYRFTESTFVDNRHVVFRLSYPHTRLVGTIFWLDGTRVGNKLECVNERIRCNGLATVSALKLRLLRTLQRRVVQQRRAAGCGSRLDRTVLADSERHGHVACDMCHSRNRRVYRWRQLSYENVCTFSAGESRILRRGTCNEHGQERRKQSENRQQPAPFHVADSILDKTLKPLSGELTR